MVPNVGIELTTYRLQGGCSTTELIRHKEVHIGHSFVINPNIIVWLTNSCGCELTTPSIQLIHSQVIPILAARAPPSSPVMDLMTFVKELIKIIDTGLDRNRILIVTISRNTDSSIDVNHILHQQLQNGSVGRIRTYDQLINSQLRYRCATTK